MPGTLIIAGTGIKAIGHLSVDARHWIARADKLLHVVVDPITERALAGLNPSAESMRVLYQPGRARVDTYAAMVERMLAELRDDRVVCAVFYGHPGVFVRPSHEAIARARAAGHVALMLPAISAQDCMIADLGVDPAWAGWQTYEATDFLVRPRVFDASACLVLWQIGAIGNLGPPRAGFERRGVELLVEVLAAVYGRAHEVVVHEAAMLPSSRPLLHRCALGELLDAPISAFSTLYVPSLRAAELDLTRVRALGLAPEHFEGAPAEC